MSKNILVVDDSKSIRQMMVFVLKSSGHSVIEAENGKQALALLDGRAIDLIVSDVNMPELDGIGLVRALRELEQYKQTPVIMLTTEADQDLRDQGSAIGIHKWLTKPFQPPVLLAAVTGI